MTIQDMETHLKLQRLEHRIQHGGELARQARFAAIDKARVRLNRARVILARAEAV